MLFDSRIIPRTFGEWLMGLLTAAQGLGFLLFPFGLQLNHWLMYLPPGSRSYIVPGWGCLLMAAGICQVASLKWSRMPRHLFAFLAALAWAFVSVMIFQSTLYYLLIPSIGLALGEVFVAVRLKPWTNGQ
jgi:hypothetical protein